MKNTRERERDSFLRVVIYIVFHCFCLGHIHGTSKLKPGQADGSWNAIISFHKFAVN